MASILEEAVRAGADAAEVSASEDCGLGVTVRMGELETVEFNRDQGFGITVYLGTRKGSASTSDSSPDAVRDAVQQAVDTANQRLSRVEQIKKFTIVRGDWLPGGDELTPTMKLKRKPIGQKYAAEIEAMYTAASRAERGAQ